MKAKELMIGDWLNTSRGIAKVIAIDEIGLTFKIDGGDFDIDRDDEEEWFDAIPLTPEILEKNGFENDFYEEESVADYHTIRLEGYSLKHNVGEIDGYLVTWCNGGINVTTDFNGCVQKDISYVHELQHALRLCGIEKEIML